MDGLRERSERMILLGVKTEKDRWHGAVRSTVFCGVVQKIREMQ